MLPEVRLKLNVEQETSWGLLPAAEREPIGSALRHAIGRSHELPTPFLTLLNRIDRRAKVSGETTS